MPAWTSAFSPVELADGRLGAQERHAASRNDAFLDRGLGRVHRVVDAVLLLLHLDLGRAADPDHRDAAGELGETLLQLLLVVVRGRVLDLRLDLRDAASMSAFLPAPSMIVVFSFSMRTRLARPSIGSVTFSSLIAEVLGDQRAAAEDGDVFEHRLAAIAEARAP